MHPIKIVSWNLQKGYRKERLEAEFPQVLALEPDFLCLQELMWEARIVLDRVLLHAKERYRLVQRPISSTAKKQTIAMTALLVRNDWQEEDAEFIRFERDEDRENTKGLLAGFFSRDGQYLRVWSVHQPAQTFPRARRIAARAIRKHFARHGWSAIVAGDFNTGFPFETHTLAKILSAHFAWLTPHVGPTCFWRRLEHTVNTYARIGQFFGRIFDIRLAIDHAFATKDLVKAYNITSRSLPEFEASDHLPVLTEFVPKK